MTLVPSDDPVLKQECEKFNFLNPQVDIREFADELIKVMRENGGIGLSANQIGVPLQIFAMASDPPMLVINPKILQVSEEMVELEEGCLSFPGDLVKVKRPMWIIARFILANGKGMTHRFEGMTARVFQHEYDHIMHGKTMFDHMSKLKRDMYMKKKAKKK